MRVNFKRKETDTFLINFNTIALKTEESKSVIISLVIIYKTNLKCN